MVCWKFSSILYRSKVIGHFRWCFEFGCNFAFETNFCKFDLWNDPIPYLFLSHIVCLAEMRILSQQAFWSVSSVSRYTHKRLSWKSPLTSCKRGVCGSNFPTGWDIFMGPQRHILGRNRVDWCIICGTRALGVGCALAEQNTGNKSASRQFHPYGEPSRDPPPIIMNFGLHGGPTDVINCPNFCFDRLRGFCYVWSWKWPFPIRSDHCP